MTPIRYYKLFFTLPIVLPLFLGGGVLLRWLLGFPLGESGLFGVLSCFLVEALAVGGVPYAVLVVVLLRGEKLRLLVYRAVTGWSKRSPARPQRVKGRGVPLRYVEGLNDARTKREAFFSILIIPLYSPWQRDRYRAWR